MSKKKELQIDPIIGDNEKVKLPTARDLGAPAEVKKVNDEYNPEEDEFEVEDFNDDLITDAHTYPHNGLSEKIFKEYKKINEFKIKANGKEYTSFVKKFRHFTYHSPVLIPVESLQDKSVDWEERDSRLYLNKCPICNKDNTVDFAEDCECHHCKFNLHKELESRNITIK